MKSCKSRQDWKTPQIDVAPIGTNPVSCNWGLSLPSKARQTFANFPTNFHPNLIKI